jgi:hypothetical protein
MSYDTAAGKRAKANALKCDDALAAACRAPIKTGPKRAGKGGRKRLRGMETPDAS